MRIFLAKHLPLLGLVLTLFLVRESQANTVFGQIGPGAIIYSSATLPGVSASFLGRVTRSGPAMFGLDTGVYFSTSGSFGMAIPFIPYLAYFFPTRDFFKPWLGFGFGGLLGFGTGVSSNFCIFFKPGMRLSVNREFEIYLETRLGLVGASLAFAPTLGAMFAF